MSLLIVLVLDNPDRTREVLDAWEAAGAPGVTILDSSGLGRARRAGIRDDIPLIPSLGDLFRREEDRHRTLFSVVPDQARVEAIIRATQAVVGELDRDDTGLLFVLQLDQVVGLPKRRGR